MSPVDCFLPLVLLLPSDCDWLTMSLDGAGNREETDTELVTIGTNFCFTCTKSNTHAASTYPHNNGFYWKVLSNKIPRIMLVSSTPLAQGLFSTGGVWVNESIALLKWIKFFVNYKNSNILRLTMPTKFNIFLRTLTVMIGFQIIMGFQYNHLCCGCNRWLNQTNKLATDLKIIYLVIVVW